MVCLVGFRVVCIRNEYSILGGALQRRRKLHGVQKLCGVQTLRTRRRNVQRLPSRSLRNEYSERARCGAADLFRRAVSTRSLADISTAHRDQTARGARCSSEAMDGKMYRC